MSSTGQTGQHKRAFLSAFAETGNVFTACQLANVARSSVYAWKDADPDFRARWVEAETVATEVLEAEARRRAVEGVVRDRPIFYKGDQVGTETIREFSDVLLIVLLKARAPDKYRERFDLTRSDVPMVKAYAREDLDLLGGAADALPEGGAGE